MLRWGARDTPIGLARGPSPSLLLGGLSERTPRVGTRGAAWHLMLLRLASALGHVLGHRKHDVAGDVDLTGGFVPARTLQCRRRLFDSS